MDIVVGLIGEFKFVVNFGQLLPSMLYLFFEGQVFLGEGLDVDILFIDLLFQSSLHLFSLLELLLGLEDLFFVHSCLLLKFITVEQFFFHLFQFQCQLFLL